MWTNLLSRVCRSGSRSSLNAFNICTGYTVGEGVGWDARDLLNGDA